MNNSRQNIDSKQGPLFSSYITMVIVLYIYALLPMAHLEETFYILRIVALGWFSHYALSSYDENFKNSIRNTYIFRIVDWFSDKVNNIINLSLEILFSYQEMLEQVQRRLTCSSDDLKILACTLVICFPISTTFLTQWLSVYVASLLAFQCATIYTCYDMHKQQENKDPGRLLSPKQDLDDYLTPVRPLKLSIAQMKLITMLLLSTCINLPFYQFATVFLFGSLLAPFVLYGLHQLFEQFYARVLSCRFPQGIKRKGIEAFIILSSLFLLLINYKYEQHVFNFVATFYSSILIGDIAMHFYNGIDAREIVVNADQLLSILYHPEILLSFWGVSFFYEVTSIYSMPHIAFIVLGLTLGVEPNPLKWCWMKEQDDTETKVSAIQFLANDPLARRLSYESNPELSTRLNAELAV